MGEWKALAAAGDWHRLVARLLEDHYDAAYRRSAAQNFPRLSRARAFALDSAAQSAFDALARDILHAGAEALQA
ncbi:hypothetical protein D3C83_105290 [compost metagenome]